MPYPFETKRLNLRPFAREDFPFMRSLHMDERIMKHIGSGIARTEEQSLVAMERSLEIEKEDARLGSWIVELNSDSSKIGILILRQPATKEEMEGLEIGYSIVFSHWGNGYAQETVRGMIMYAQKQFGPVRINALIKPENEASRNVLTKTGFKTQGMTEFVYQTNGQIHISEVLAILRRH